MEAMEAKSSEIARLKQDKEIRVALCEGFFMSIDSELGNRSGWDGLAYGKCLREHEAVKEYRNTISPICNTLK